MKHDTHQARYIAHQARKRETLIEIMRERHSERMFSSSEVSRETLDRLTASVEEVGDLAPSSCDRKAIYAVATSDRDLLALLGGILVGGVGWIHRAPLVMLVFADPRAYVAGDEIHFMPYLDAGCYIQQVLLWATAEGLHSAYANPNIRPENVDFFQKRFGDDIFCGAIALGYPPEKK